MGTLAAAKPPSSTMAKLGAVGRAEVEVVGRLEVATAEAVALVADGGQDLGVAQLAAGLLAPRGHGAAGAPLAADVDAGAVGLADVRLVARVDEGELVSDLVERLVHGAAGERVADAALALGAVARRALAGEDGLALAERPAEGLGRRLEAAGVHVGPQRQEAHHGDGPERDAPAALGGGDVGRIGLAGRRCRRRRAGRAGRGRCCGDRRRGARRPGWPGCCRCLLPVPRRRRGRALLCVHAIASGGARGSPSRRHCRGRLRGLVNQGASLSRSRIRPIPGSVLDTDGVLPRMV